MPNKTAATEVAAAENASPPTGDVAIAPPAIAERGDGDARPVVDLDVRVGRRSVLQLGLVDRVDPGRDRQSSA